MAEMVCTECNEKLKWIKGVTNLHITGDAKDVDLYQCRKCGGYYLEISMEAWLSYGTNYFAFMIKLEENEADEIKGLLEACPAPRDKDCTCPAHAYLDKFDWDNKERRIILEDETDYY